MAKGSHTRTRNNAKQKLCTVETLRLSKIPNSSTLSMIIDRCVAIENPANNAYTILNTNAPHAANHGAGIRKNAAGTKRHDRRNTAKTMLAIIPICNPEIASKCAVPVFCSTAVCSSDKSALEPNANAVMTGAKVRSPMLCCTKPCSHWRRVLIGYVPGFCCNSWFIGLATTYPKAATRC